MSAQRGKALLIRLGDGADPENFSTVAGLRTKRLSLNAATVDVTNADSTDQWRELLAGAGVRSAQVAGDGVFKDAPSDEAVRAAFFAQTHDTWQIVVPDFGILEGRFQISALDYRGTHDGEATWSLTLDSAGPVAFTPDA